MKIISVTKTDDGYMIEPERCMSFFQPTEEAANSWPDEGQERRLINALCDKVIELQIDLDS